MLRLQWDSAPSGGNSAVAVPRDPSSLFATPFSTSTANNLSLNSIQIKGETSHNNSPHHSHNSSFNLGHLTRRESKGISNSRLSANMNLNNITHDFLNFMDDNEDYDHGIIAPTVPPMTLPLRPYLDTSVGGIELEILNLIAKVRKRKSKILILFIRYFFFYYSVLIL